MPLLAPSLLCLSPLLSATHSAFGLPEGGARPPDDTHPATVRGRVVDPRGEPARGALVELRYHVGGPPWNWGSIGVSCDGEGRFQSTVLPPGSTTAIARGAGWAASEPEVVLLEPGEVLEGLELALRPGGRLTGEVLDRACGGSRGIDYEEAWVHAGRYERRECRGGVRGWFERLWHVFDPPDRRQIEPVAPRRIGG